MTSVAPGGLLRFRDESRMTPVAPSPHPCLAAIIPPRVLHSLEHHWTKMRTSPTRTNPPTPLLFHSHTRKASSSLLYVPVLLPTGGRWVLLLSVLVCLSQAPPCATKNQIKFQKKKNLYGPTPLVFASSLV